MDVTFGTRAWASTAVSLTSPPGSSGQAGQPKPWDPEWRLLWVSEALKRAINERDEDRLGSGRHYLEARHGRHYLEARLNET